MEDADLRNVLGRRARGPPRGRKATKRTWRNDSKRRRSGDAAAVRVRYQAAVRDGGGRSRSGEREFLFAWLANWTW